MLKRSLLILTVLLFCQALSRAQPNGIRYKTRYYSTTNGLAGNDVMKTVMDHNGFLWIATHNGISRFDGHEFKNYSHIPGDTTSLRSIWATDLLTDNAGTLWATTEWGVCYYDPVADHFRYIHPKDSLTILYKSPLAIDKSGRIWLAAENGLFYIDPVKKTIHSTSLKRVADPQCISFDASGNIVIGTRGGGLFYYYPSTGISLSLHYKGLKPDTHYMASLYYDGSTWLATSEGLLEMRNSSDFRVYAGPEGQQLMSLLLQSEDNPPRLLLSTYDKRIVQFSLKDKKFSRGISAFAPENNGLLNTVIYHIEHRYNSLWFSTQQGLFRLQADTDPVYPQNSELKALSGEPLHIDHIKPDRLTPNRYLLFSRQDGGTLLFYDVSEQKITLTTRPPVSGRMHTAKETMLLQNSKGTIYAAADEQFFIYNQQGKLTHTLSTGTVVLSGCLDKEENIWLGTADGLAFINAASRELTHYPCSFTGTDVERTSSWFSFTTFGVTDYDENSLWLTSGKYGLFHFNKQTHQFTPYRQPFTGLYETRNRCSGIIARPDTLWIGNMAGLSMFIPSKKQFTQYDISSGLQSTYVYSLVQTSAGIVWGRGNMGVFRFDPARPAFRNYSLPAVYNEYYFQQNIYTDGENALLGLTGKFARFQKEKNKETQIPLLLNRLVSGNTTIAVKTAPEQPAFAVLPYYQNDLRIEFTAINFLNEPVYYNYKLEGLDKQWNDAGVKNQVNYSNLKPGVYVFTVRCKRGEGDWEEAQQLLTIKIKAAYWQTRWFKALVIFLALTLAVVFYQWRIRVLKQRQREKSRLQQLELEQYRQQLETEQVTSFFSTSLVDKETVDEVLHDVAKNLIAKMGFEDCMIYMWNAGKTKLLQRTGFGVKGAIEDNADTTRYDIPAGKGIIGSSVQLKQPLIVNDTAADPRYISVDGIYRRSELCVPVLDNDTVIGAINIEQTEKDFFTRYHLQVVTTIAALMAGKIKALESRADLHQKQLELAETSKLLAEQEVAMLRSQMNPHFIFNSLNSVQKYIWENKEEDAAEYLASFAKLMRSILENSRHAFISLEKEISFLKLYTELENRRSNNSFNYVIKADEQLDMDGTQIPPLLLQPFIENAIWHGLNKKKEKGNLLVHIYKKDNQLVCVVDDDGVGRQAAENGEKKSVSLGIFITRQRVERLMENTSRMASVTIHDKIKDGQPAGTEVTVIIPLQLLNTE